MSDICERHCCDSASSQPEDMPTRLARTRRKRNARADGPCQAARTGRSLACQRPSESRFRPSWGQPANRHSFSVTPNMGSVNRSVPESTVKIGLELGTRRTPGDEAKAQVSVQQVGHSSRVLRCSNSAQLDSHRVRVRVRSFLSR